MGSHGPWAIESRISAAFRWRRVTVAGHSERHTWDPVTGQLRFDALADAQVALDGLRAANGAAFRVVQFDAPVELFASQLLGVL